MRVKRSKSRIKINQQSKTTKEKDDDHPAIREWKSGEKRSRFFVSSRGPRERKMGQGEGELRGRMSFQTN